jgi:hypothetical protein
MSRKQRRIRNLSWMADGITEHIENGVYEGRITRAEGEAMYRMFGHSCHMADLLPRRVIPATNQKLLKHQIKMRLEGKALDKLPLPDSKRGPITQMQAMLRRLKLSKRNGV